MTDTQTATAPDGQGQPVPEETGGEPKQTLDELLKGYETTETEKPEPKPQPNAIDPARFEKVVAHVEQDAVRRENEAFEKDLGEAVKTVIGEDLAVDEKLVSAYVLDRLKMTPGGPQAWLDRNKNPTGFQGVLKGIRQELVDMTQQKPDEELTDNRSAMRSAITGTSKPTEQDADHEKKINEMSRAEFETWARNQR